MSGYDSRMPEPMSALRPQIRSWAWAFGSQGTQIALRAASFLLVARALAVAELGIFVSLAAATNLLAPFAGTGAANLLIRDVARDRTLLASRWDKLISAMTLSGAILCVVATLACWFLVAGRLPVWEIAGFAAAELLALRFVHLTELTLQGLGMIHRMAQVSILVNFSRLAISLIFFALPPALRNIHSWLQLYIANAVVVASCAMWWSFRAFGAPHLGRPAGWRDFKEGFWFAVSPFTQIVNNDADKLLLPRLADLSSAGIYGAAYRVLSVAFLPVLSMLTVTYPHFFRKGSGGIRHSIRLAVRALPIALSYSITAGILLYWGAPLVARILGPDYRQTATVIRYLAALPTLKALQYFFADAITGADFQAIRVGLQTAVAILNVGLNLLWIPRHGWMGAVWATLISDGTLAILLIAATATLRRKEPVQNALEELTSGQP